MNWCVTPTEIPAGHWFGPMNATRFTRHIRGMAFNPGLTEKRRTASKQFVTKPHPLGGTSTTGARAASCAIKEMRRLAMPPANCGAGRHSVQSSNDRCARHWNCRMGNHQSTIIDVHCLEPPDSRHTRQSGGQQLDFRADAPLPGVDDPADKGSRSLPHDTDRG